MNAGDSARDLDAARRNPRQHDGLEVRIALDDFVRDPAQRAVELPPHP